MSTILLTLLCAIVITALLIVGLGVKMFFKKKGEFKRHCSGMDPYTGKSSGCVCGKAANTKCKEEKKYSPLEVNGELMKEVNGD